MNDERVELNAISETQAMKLPTAVATFLNKSCPYPLDNIFDSHAAIDVLHPIPRNIGTEVKKPSRAGATYIISIIYVTSIYQ